MDYGFTKDDIILLKSKNRISRNNLIHKKKELVYKIDNYCVIRGVSFSEAIYLILNNIEIPLCVNCGIKKPKFKSNTEGYKKYCSTKCSNSHIDTKQNKVNVFMERYGVENPSYIKEVREKISFKLSNQSEETKQKRKSTMIIKYGVESNVLRKEVSIKRKEVLKHSNVIEKRIKTCLEKYGTEKPLESEQVKNKIKKTNLERWGNEHFSKSKVYQELNLNRHISKLNLIHSENNLPQIISLNEREYKMFCGKCNTEFEIGLNAYNIRKNKSIEICTICCPVEHNRSALENDLALFIEENYNGELIRGKRFNNKELDIYLPELNIGIEFNGVYWHSEFKKENDYHLKKHQYFTDLDIQLIQVWEDDYNYKREIVESMLLNKLGKSNSIYGRKCIIKEVSNKDTVDFLNDNHIQGWCVSKIRYGLYYNDELVCLMTFGKNRLNLGGSSAESEFELLRFCNKLNTNVVGGSSKLLNYFIKVNNPKKITSYSKNDYSNGDLYKKLNFELISTSDANYYWVVDGIRVNRFNFRKDKLVKEGFDSNLTEVKIMHQRGYWRTFDSGNKKWIYFI
jgi:hypothetical protein